MTIRGCLHCPWRNVFLCMVQARLLPEEHVKLQIYSVNTHRLAYYLDAQGQLLPLIRASLLQQMGLPSGHVRLANLL